MRQGLDHITRPLEDGNAGSSIFLYSSFYSNFLGCFLIGFFGMIEKSNIRLALCTGLCGCLTTFSGWNNQQAVWLATDLYKDDIYSRIVSISTWIVNIPALIGALAFGRDCGFIFYKRKPIQIPFLASVITFGLLIILLILLAVFIPDHRYDFTTIFF